ncbi:hypothetical protein [Halorubellus salinus]|uniref:hypothetical protein n=1 Tax=Halorubellus salinus TaxID=755309 RepID=UPI001D079DC8|nr:hypothetical protein [Halorubellus salinus]
MRENWYRRAFFAGLGGWIGGLLAIAMGIGAVAYDLGPWWGGVAIGVLSGSVGGYVGAAVTYDWSMHERLHGSVGLAAFVVVPVVGLVGVLVGVVTVASPSEAIVASSLVGATTAVLGGVVVLVANLQLWKASVQAAAAPYAKWSARRPPTQRRRTKYAVGGLAVLAVGAGAVVFVVGAELDATWVTIVAPWPALLASVDTERTVEVRDAGVLVDSSLVAWDDYECFELTDEALVLHRASRYVDRAHRFDRDDVDDLDETVRALERFLARRES